MTEKNNDEKLRLAKKVELLAPAGDMERLKYAIIYGADAVYFGSEEFSLRAKAQNFNTNNIREALDFCHERGKKAYMTVNIYAHNDDISGLYEYIKELKKFDIDTFIVFFNRWRVIGGSTSILGLPNSNLYTEADGRSWQSFERGYIISSKHTGTWDIVDGFYKYWSAQGGSLGRLGKPTSARTIEPNGVRWQTFERGKAVWSIKDGWKILQN